MKRRGFTLVELLIALVIGAVVGTATVRVIRGTQRTTEAGMERVGLQQTLRAGTGYMTSVLRDLDAGDGDIVSASDTLLRFRSMRWASPLCDAPTAGTGSAVTFLIDASEVYGLRTPDSAEDSVFVFSDGDTDTRSDDTWLIGAVNAVGTGNCSDGSNATSLTVNITAASGGQAAALADVTSGSPVRGFQMEELSLIQSDGRWWVGQRTANRSGTWSAVQPLVGPLAAGGLALTYFDSTGAATGTLTDIASVGITLRAETTNRVRTQAGSIGFARDSLVTRVALRNNPRF